MASSTSQPFTFDLGAQLKRKFSLGPENWDAFAEAAESKGGDTWVPPSGAHVTLRDLSRDPSTISFPSNDDPAVVAAIEDDHGWVGTPDPTKYAPGTSRLSPKELQEEVDKGNVMMWKDFKKQVSELQGEDREALMALVQQRVMQERMFFTLKDGSKVSVWDLHQYVENNPEMAALYERRRRFPTADPDDPAGRPLSPEPLTGLERSAGQPLAVVGPEEAEELELDWRQAPLQLPRRLRPTVIDPTDLNGATWPRLFLEASPEERAAERAAGADELGVSWRTMEAGEHELSRKLGLAALQAIPQALCPGADPASWPLTGSSLVDRRGTLWRQGGSVWVTLEPEGGVLVQAQSPGLVGEQESFQLVRLQGQDALAGAVVEAFMGPRPLDPEMAAAARLHMLLPINGFTAGNKERNPNHPIQEGPPPRPLKAPADPAAFRLAPPGQPSPEDSLLLDGVRLQRVATEVSSLLDGAVQAAAAAGEPTAAEARQAALAALREGVGRLGPDARSSLSAAAAAREAADPAMEGLVAALARDPWPAARLVPDLFSLARSLDAEAPDEQQE
ncbi:hypothetical protein GPECTOR_78g77 [Gonium pectorale]|uniref:Uncharacterized protein n=1 Tax=Gonium pectorale TaxID=33097 RepID=A0A150G1Y8_GONPE|nr:hypothetical protein GPECTOR_78g77 [Gonium pectorale]|eukprot:KXZ43889.1 hypothetical protein GPECTOR_78g77 [Gonium pectorale]